MQRNWNKIKIGPRLFSFGTIAIVLVSSASTIRAESLAAWIQITPTVAHVGEPVIYSMQASGGSGNYESVWVSDDVPARIQLGPAFTNIYTAIGWKSAMLNLQSMTNGYVEQLLERKVSIEVFNSLDTTINVLSPNGGEIWEVGKTYEIRWTAIGSADKVQIGLRDRRFNTELGNAGELTIAYSISNNGSFSYTVPNPDTNGISGGNIGGTNYSIIVYPWGGGTSGHSSNFFSIIDTKPKTLSLLSLTNGSVIFRINGRSNLVYQIEESLNLMQWHPFWNPVIAVADSFIAQFPAGTNAQAFYRLR